MTQGGFQQPGQVPYPTFQPNIPPPNFRMINEEEMFVPNPAQVSFLDKSVLGQQGFIDLGSLAAIMGTTESQLGFWMARRRAAEDKKEQDDSFITQQCNE